MINLHPVAVYASRGVLTGLRELEREIEFAETVDEAFALHECLLALSAHADRLERCAIRRAETLIGGSSACA